MDPVTGAPASTAVMYDDRRGASHLDRVSTVGAAVWTRLGYRMQASWALPTMLALLQESTIGATDIIGHQPDVITSHLAGRLLPSDISSALKSGADLDTIQWPEEVLSALGVQPTQLNTLVDSGAQIGAVCADAAAQTGLPVGCAIIAGMTDGCAAQIAAGALTPGSWNSVLGTTLVFKGASTTRHNDLAGAVYAHRAPFDGGWYPGGASSSGAGVIPQLLPGRDLAALTTAAAGNPLPAPSYPLVGCGERFPFVADNATAFYPAHASDSELFAAILHGISCVERLSFDVLSAAGYDTSGRILLTGGGTRNAWWNQLRADQLGRDLFLPAHGEGAAGMAILAAAGHAAASGARQPDPLDKAARRMSGTPTRVSADAQRHSAASELYTRFLDSLEHTGWAPDVVLAAGRTGAAA